MLTLRESHNGFRLASSDGPRSRKCEELFSFLISFFRPMLPIETAFTSRKIYAQNTGTEEL